MALVQTPRALLLQQAADDRLHAVPRHHAVGRQRVRRAVFLPAHRGNSFAAPAALRRARTQRPRRLLPRRRDVRDAAHGRRRDPDDHRPALRALLDRGVAGGLAGDGARLARAVGVDRRVAGPRFPEQIHRAVSTRVLGDLLRALAAGTAASAQTRPVARARHQSARARPRVSVEPRPRLGHRRAPSGSRRSEQRMEIHLPLFQRLRDQRTTALEPRLPRRVALGGRRVLAALPRPAAVALSLQHGIPAVPRLLALQLPRARAAQLDRARHAPDVSAHGVLLGVPLARRLPPRQGLVDRRPARDAAHRSADPREQAGAKNRRPPIARAD